MALLDDLIPKEIKLSDDYEEGNVPCEFITGAAGTGKTYLQKKAIEDDPSYGILCATTGIAAINLGATTLNSVLKFFDTNSLRDRFNRGTLAAVLHRLAKKYKAIVIDEISMMDAIQLDLIFQALREVNNYQDMQEKNRQMKLILTGDFCQLPPVKAKFVFEAECWEHFERNTTKLTKIWRQEDSGFLEALGYARAGQGKQCVQKLIDLGVTFVPQTIHNFNGTTILPVNTTVDNFNFSALLNVPGTSYTLRRRAWGEQSGEWKNIPEELKLKDGCYVMVLNNDTETGTFSYANGDCGVVQSKDVDGTVWVKLSRTEKLVGIKPIIRYKPISHEDGKKLGLDPFHEGKGVEGQEGWSPRIPHLFCNNDCGWDVLGRRNGMWGFPSYSCSAGVFNVGAVEFYPLRLAYATSVHKSQGLTLDRCQIDCRHAFFGEPGMAYVALSRCRTPKGLTIAGTPDTLAERIKVDPKVVRWL